MRRGRGAGPAIGAFLVAVTVASVSLSFGVMARAADKAKGACALVSARSVSSIFGVEMKAPRTVPDRPSDVPGGIVTSCSWKSGSKTVSLSVSGAGRGGASYWDARASFDAASTAGSDAGTAKHVRRADEATLFAVHGHDRLAVLAGDYFVEGESTRTKPRASNAKALVRLVQKVLPRIEPAVFTESKAVPKPSIAQTLLGTTRRNVSYCTADGRPLTLDMYYPSASTAPRLPVIVYVHGGALTSGDKGTGPATPAGAHLPAATARGYVFVSINYRLAPMNKWPVMIEDSNCAVRFLRANANALGLDPNAIGLIGSSSGGTLVSLMGVTGADAAFEGTGEYQGVSSRVQAVVDEYGANMDLRAPPFSAGELQSRQQAYVQPLTPELVESATVVNHVSPDDPPFFIVHGDHDPLVNPQESRDLDAALRAAGVPSTLLIVTNGSHGFLPQASRFGPITPTWDEILQREMDFLDQYLKH